MAVTENNIPAALQNVISNNNEINFGDYAKIIGSINALSKKVLIGSEDLAKVDPAPMKKAVAFCSKIKTSKTVCEAFNKVKPTDKNLVVSSAKHVDGTISSTERNEILKWLKDTPPDGRDCRISTNARCLSEGVDVPSLDAVLFLASKKSKIEIVQAVGRVMRKADASAIAVIGNNGLMTLLKFQKITNKKFCNLPNPTNLQILFWIYAKISTRQFPKKTLLKCWLNI